ncbi:MAG TPA: transcriptional regulator [Candidatus Yaniella excrementigallinarum]|nr:transcriptional regulator [Candidatus Yaniella excrementigallinarum]
MTQLDHQHSDPADNAYQQAVTAAHEKLTDAVVDPTHVRSQVTDSWRRCLALHDNPAKVTTPVTISTESLADHRKTHPIAAVLPMLRTLLAPAHDVGLITAISNPYGHLLWVDGATKTRDRAENIGFAPGADWSEASMGTSAPGAALSTGATAQVAGAEHFSHNVHEFYCSAIPLRHPSGSVLGMLDLTGSPIAVSSLALAMLSNTAHAIEQFWATHTFPGTPYTAEPELTAATTIDVASGNTARIGELRLSNRHAEILTLLDWHRTGLNATQLAYELFGELAPDQLSARLTTVRAEISRLRKILDSSDQPVQLCSQPYRIDSSLTTDAAAAMAALHRGDLSAALRLAPAEVLPTSEAPGVVHIRRQLGITLREAVLADANADQLWCYLSRSEASNDVEAWMLALQILPPDSPRRAVVTATLQRLGS